jgi:hypothetical protein
VAGLALGLALGCAAPVPAGVALADADAPELALARAFGAAWNDGDLDAVVALFAEDAVVRQRGAEIEHYGANVVISDAFGVRLVFVGDPPASDAAGVVWARGRPELRTWARRLLAAGHRFEAANHRAGSDAVRWDYRATTDLARRWPWLRPAAGTAELTARAGLIVTLTTESDPASTRAREAALARAVPVAGPSTHAGLPDTQARGPATPGPWLAAAAGSLLGVLALSLGKAHSRTPRDGA